MNDITIEFSLHRNFTEERQFDKSAATVKSHSFGAGLVRDQIRAYGRTCFFSSSMGRKAEKEKALFDEQRKLFADMSSD